MTLASPTADASSACQSPEVDPDWWHGDDPANVANAVACCHRCPQEQACLIWALRTRQRGPVVFGGHWFRPPKTRMVS